MQQHPQPTTITILGADTVVGRALCALLESSGYQTRPLGAYPTGVVDELLEGADLLLLTPRVDQGVREAFLGAMGKSTPQKADIPVIALSTSEKEGLPVEGVLRVPWPCETKVLVERIEAAFLCRRHLPDLLLNPGRGERALGTVTRLLSKELRLPPGYRLDPSDPDVLVLRCPHGTAIARFSAQCTATEAIEQQARMHYRERNRSA